MFVWSYWKTIFTKPANPSKEVGQLSCTNHIKSNISLTPTFCYEVGVMNLRFKNKLCHPAFITVVLPSQMWEGTLWERGKARVSAGDPLESSQQSASLHSNRRWRYVLCRTWCFSEMGLVCLFVSLSFSLSISFFLSVVAAVWINGMLLFSCEQQSVTVTAVKLSSQTDVITARHVTCKTH